MTYSIPGARGESPGPVYEPVNSAKGFVRRGELIPDRLNNADFIARRVAYTSSMAAVDEWNTKRSKDGLVKVNSLADGAFEVLIDGKFIARYRYHEGGLRYECLSADLFR